MRVTFGSSPPVNTKPVCSDCLFVGAKLEIPREDFSAVQSWHNEQTADFNN